MLDPENCVHHAHYAEKTMTEPSPERATRDCALAPHFTLSAFAAFRKGSDQDLLLLVYC